MDNVVRLTSRRSPSDVNLLIISGELPEHFRSPLQAYSRYTLIELEKT